MKPIECDHQTCTIQSHVLLATRRRWTGTILVPCSESFVGSWLDHRGRFPQPKFRSPPDSTDKSDIHGLGWDEDTGLRGPNTDLSGRANFFLRR